MNDINLYQVDLSGYPEREFKDDDPVIFINTFKDRLKNENPAETDVLRFWSDDIPELANEGLGGLHITITVRKCLKMTKSNPDDANVVLAWHIYTR